MSDFDYTVKVTDNTEFAKEELKTAVQRALYAMGVAGVDGAVDSITNENHAIDTGRLRASISFITPTESGSSGEASTASESGDKLSGSAEANTVYIGSNVQYADFVHNGTSKMAARPFLKDGIDAKRDEMQRQTEMIFKGEL